MENVRTLKRHLSEESLIVVQSKMHVNEKIVNANDCNKMKQIHAKTIHLLFAAARQKNTNVDNKSKTVEVPIWKQFTLTGNGEFHMKNSATMNDSAMEQHKSTCCQRQVYIRDNCNNCTMPLCEHCGYSCDECEVFLCHSCVLLFGCGTVDHPICEKCALYD